MSKQETSEKFHYETDIQENHREKIEAHAFRSLVRHLQERSDVVSNLDLMTTGGFCRNCLAKVSYFRFMALVETCFIVAGIVPV